MRMDPTIPIRLGLGMFPPWKLCPEEDYAPAHAEFRHVGATPENDGLNTSFPGAERPSDQSNLSVQNIGNREAKARDFLRPGKDELASVFSDWIWKRVGERADAAMGVESGKIRVDNGWKWGKLEISTQLTFNHGRRREAR